MSSSSRAQAIALPPSPVMPSVPFHDDLTQVDARWWQSTTLYKNNLGFLLLVAAQFFFTLTKIAIKIINRLERPVPALEIVLVCAFIMYFFSVSYMLLRKIPHPMLGPPGVRSLLIFRGFSGFFSLFGIYYALNYLTLSDTVTLSFLSPTATAVAGYIFLHETLSRREVFAGLLSLAGVVLIARPQAVFGPPGGEDKIAKSFDVNMDAAASAVDTVSSSQRLLAVGAVMLGIAGVAGAYISQRAIGTRAHALHSLTYFSSYSLLVSAGTMLALRVTPVISMQWRWCGLLLVIGISGYIAQILLIMGLQRETASRGSLAIYTQVIFACLFDRLVFKTVPSYLSLLGMFVIIGSGLYVVFMKAKGRNGYERVP